MSKKKVQLSESIEFPEQKIVPVDIEKQVRQGFIEYSMSVITSRALPDVRDGMKPGQRRILYAMYEDNLTYDKPFRKSRVRHDGAHGAAFLLSLSAHQRPRQLRQRGRRRRGGLPLHRGAALENRG